MGGFAPSIKRIDEWCILLRECKHYGWASYVSSKNLDHSSYHFIKKQIVHYLVVAHNLLFMDHLILAIKNSQFLVIVLCTIQGKTRMWICNSLVFAVFAFPSVLSYNEREVPLSDQSTYAHNKVRNLHNVQPLQWDTELSASAKHHADILAVDNSFEHSQGAYDGLYGENVYKAFDGFLEEKKVGDAVFNWFVIFLLFLT